MKVLGLDGMEVKAVAKYNTFCNLCNKKVHKGETITTWSGHSYVVHVNCGTAEDRIGNQEFRDYAKLRKYKKRHKRKTGSLRSPSPSLRSVVLTSKKKLVTSSLEVEASERSEDAGSLGALMRIY